MASLPSDHRRHRPHHREPRAFRRHHEEVERSLAEPGGCRLLIVNIGNPADPRPSELIEAARTGMEDHLASGGALLGVHSSATSMTTMSQWPAILGGRWLPGRSMHPPQSETTIILS